MRKAAITAASILAVIAVGAGLFSAYAPSSSCENRIIEQLVSPSGAQKAVLFERSCGATTGFSSQVSVLTATATLPNESGNALVVDGDAQGYQLSWSDGLALRVVGVNGQAFKRESQVSGVSIRYE